MAMDDDHAEDKKPKKAYKELTLEEKVMLIKQAQSNPHCSQATLARQYGIAKSNACRILKRRNEYLSAYASSNFGGDRKRKMRDVDTRELDIKVKKWIEQCFSAAKPISASQIQDKAREISQDLGLTNFTANSSWLQNFQKAYFNCSSSSLPDKGNETLRAHMYKQHSISRMFMCRCCNWAFPDKTSLHIHMQAMATGNPGNVSIIAKSSTSPNNPPSSLRLPPTLAPPTNPIESSPHHLSHPHLSALSFLGSAGLFPNMASRDDLFQRLKERAFLNGASVAAAQAGMGLASWLSHFPKVDASGVGNLGGSLVLNGDDNDEHDNNTMVVVGESASPNSNNGHNDQEMAEMIEDDGEEDMPHSRCASDIDVEHNHIQEHHYDTKPDINGGDTGIQDSVISQSPTSVSDPAGESKDMPALRSAINSSPLNSLMYQRKQNGVLRRKSVMDEDDYEPEAKRSNSRDELGKHIQHDESFHVSTSNRGEGGSSYASPTETHSLSSSNCNSSPSSHGSPKQSDLHNNITVTTSLAQHPFPFTFGGSNNHRSLPVMNCFGCQILRGKLGLSENRNRFLEAKVTSLESKVGRLESRIATLDGNSRRYEFEGKALREQSDVLQRKLLDCQERALTFLQQGAGRSDPSSMHKFVTDVLHTTYLANQ